MIHASAAQLAAWEEAWLSDIIDKHIKITVHGETDSYILDTEIVADSLRLTQALTDGSEMSFTGCLSSTLEIEVIGDQESLVGKRITVELQAGTTTAIAVFVGFVDSAEKGSTEETIKLTCYDALYGLRSIDLTTWYRDQPRQTISSLTTALLARVGIQKSDVFNLGANGSLEVDCHELYTEANKKYLPENTTALGILKAICAVCGCWGFIDRDGAFGTKTITDLGSDNFEAPFYMQEQHEDYVVAAPDAVISTNSDSLIHDSADDMSPCVSNNTENPQNPYVLKGNILALSYGAARRQPMVNTLYGLMSQVSYRPFTATVPALPWYFMGDGLTLDGLVLIGLKRVCGLYEENWSADGSSAGESAANLNSTGRASDEQLSSLRGGGDASDKMDKVNPTGSGALTISHGTTTTDTYVSIGRKESSVIGTSSLAIGHNTSARATNGIAIGTNSDAQSGVSIGNGAISVNNGVAIGDLATSGTGCATVGMWNNNWGNNMYRGGYYTVAVGYHNFVCYYDTASRAYISGDSSIAIGKENKIGGASSTAIGQANEIVARDTYALGHNLTSKVNGQVLLGHHNKGEIGNIFELGNGTSAVAKSNAVWVTEDGVLHALTDVEANGVKLSEAGGGGTNDYNELINRPIYTAEDEQGRATTQFWEFTSEATSRLYSMFFGDNVQDPARPFFGVYDSEGQWLLGDYLALQSDCIPNNANMFTQFRGQFGLLDDTITDLNNVSGFYFGRVKGTTANLPVANDCYLLSLGYNSNYTVQIVTRVTYSQNKYFVRKLQNGTWSDWSTLDFENIVTKDDTHRFTFDIPGEGSKTITKTVTNDGFRIKVTTLGNRVNSDGEWLISSNVGATNTAVKTVLAATDITFDTSVAQKVKITNANPAAIRVIVDFGNSSNVYTVS